MTSCTLELIIESNTCQKHTTYVALLDAEKAFDKVWHDGLFHKLDNTNIDPSHTCNALLRSLYSDLESQVFWDGKASESIPILQGVRQGGVLSPLLYNVFIDGLIKLLKEKNLWYRQKETPQLFSWEFSCNQLAHRESIACNWL